MEINNLKNVDPDDIDCVLSKIQRSFDIKLDNEGLKNVDTFGSLCDEIFNKIKLEHSEGCTTQHAFYKLRGIIANTANLDKCSITPQTKLSEIFPPENRLELISEIENELGFEVNLLQPRQWVLGLFILMLAASVFVCFYNWQIGLAGAFVSMISMKLAGKFGKEMHLKTVGDLANKISRESYLKSRRNQCTVNKNEVEKKIRELFVHDLDLEPMVLTRNSRF